MNRTIKFRGLRTDGKGWVYGVPFYISGERKCFIIDNCQSGNLTQEDSVFYGKEVQYESVGQFTGVKDQNGQDIYDSDKVHFDATPYLVGGLKTDGVIVNHKGSWAIKYQCQWTTKRHYMYYNFSCEDFVGKKSKIIGSIHTQDGGQEG